MLGVNKSEEKKNNELIKELFDLMLERQKAAISINEVFKDMPPADKDKLLAIGEDIKQKTREFHTLHTKLESELRSLLEDTEGYKQKMQEIQTQFALRLEEAKNALPIQAFSSPLPVLAAPMPLSALVNHSPQTPANVPSLLQLYSFLSSQSNLNNQSSQQSFSSAPPSTSDASP